MNIAPSITASDSRIASDLETSERLMRLFDTERKIEENAILKSGLLDSPDKQVCNGSAVIGSCVRWVTWH